MIPTFLSVITFAAGLVLLGSAVCYVIAAFKGKSGKPPADEPEAAKSVPEGERDKKDKKKSLASQGAAPGVV